MRRGFGRRRRRGAEPSSAAPIEEAWISRVQDAGLATSLERTELEGVEPSVALLARVAAPAGEDAPGDDDAPAPSPTPGLSVAIAPRSAGDALLAAVALAASSDSPGPVLAVAERIDARALRRHACIGGLPEAPRLATVHGDGPAFEATEPIPAPWSPARLAEGPTDPALRSLTARVLNGLEGLAAKHDGSVRSAGSGVELVVLARPVATLRIEGDEPILEIIDGGSERLVVAEASVVDALDRVEGTVRKRMNDRRVRDGEEGLRGRALGALERAAGLRFAARWPLSGPDPDALDLAGVAEDGTPVVAAVRKVFGLRDLGAVLDAALWVEPWLPALLAASPSPVRVARPRLVLAAERVSQVVRDVAKHLALEVVTFELAESAGRVTLRPQDSSEAAEIIAPASLPGAPLRRRSAEPAEREDAGRGDGPPRSRGGRNRRGRGRGRGPRAEDSGEARSAVADAAPEADASSDAPAEPSGPRFDEVSLFDLDLESEEDGGGDGSRRRGGRRRRRGRRRNGDAPDERAARDGEPAGETESGSDDEGAPRRKGRSRGRGGRGRGSASEDRGGREAKTRGGDDASADEDVVDDDVLELAEAPDLDETPDLKYEDEEGADEESEPETEADRIRLERERRRLARQKDAAPSVEEVEPEAEEVFELPRGRVAILAHADRESIAAAVLLARDWRQVEGIWIYPQSELMTFFRSVTTDLRDNTPILVVGFDAHPTRDVIQAASLYRGRLAWYDHHTWAPEDEEAMRQAIGRDHLHLKPGAGSSLAAVLPTCARRSRFSDKLVDLVTGRFSVHDHQRWGGLWWWRLGDLASRPGERHNELEHLVAGRPSDLAREAQRAEKPPMPEEIAWVASHDFRLVHFGGLSLVVLDVPVGLDVHLAGRLVRERYGATLSLARTAGDAVVVLGADDVTGRRAVDVSGMVAHLSEKFAWAHSLPDADHVARLRIADLTSQPERLDDVVAEIGMGRSILEG